MVAVLGHAAFAKLRSGMKKKVGAANLPRTGRACASLPVAAKVLRFFE